MRKQKVTITIQLSADEYGGAIITCDSHAITFNEETGTFEVTFVNGRDTEGDEITEILIGANSFVTKAVALLPDEEEETVTISKDEYEGLKETIAILSDKDTRDELTQAEADVIAGNLVTLTPGLKPFTSASSN